MLCPQNCYGLDDSGLAVGYVIGTADTTAFKFVTQWLERYVPVWVAQGIEKPGMDIDTTQEGSVDALREMAHIPREQSFQDQELVDAFPAHLHIDIGPDHSGKV